MALSIGCALQEVGTVASCESEHRRRWEPATMRNCAVRRAIDRPRRYQVGNVAVVR